MGWVILGLGVVACIVAVTVDYVDKHLTRLHDALRRAYANIDVLLRQRSDLIPSLRELVRDHAASETETVEALVGARSATISAGAYSDMERAAAADDLMTTAIGRVFDLGEAYPDLKANANFVDLQDEFAEFENNLAAARRVLNLAVAEYNAFLEQYPAKLLVRMVGLKPGVMFVLHKESRA